MDSRPQRAGPVIIFLFFQHSGNRLTQLLTRVQAAPWIEPALLNLPKGESQVSRGDKVEQVSKGSVAKDTWWQVVGSQEDSIEIVREAISMEWGREEDRGHSWQEEWHK